MNQLNNDKHEDAIDFTYFFTIIWQRKNLIAAITILSLVVSTIFSLNMQNIYISKSLLVPTNQDDSLSSKIGGLSSLSGLAGFTLPNTPTSKSQEAIERIKSFEFFSNQFLPNIKLENLMAIKKWKPEENIILYDRSVFDSEQNMWVRKVSFPKKIKPSDQEAYLMYKDIINISEDKSTSFVTVSVEHQSPIIAQTWVSLIIKNINEHMKIIDAEQAEKSILYLNQTAASTNVESIKDAISKLLENQMQTLMLTASNEDYIFKKIDSPIIPEIHSKPSRFLIIFLSTVFGMLISIFYILILHMINSFKLMSSK